MPDSKHIEFEESLEGVTRRTFLRNAAGVLVSVNFISLASRESAAAVAAFRQPTGANAAAVSPPIGTPGSAAYRIDGVAKVTGARIFARDYYAKDMTGWPAAEMPVMIVRATNVTDIFTGVDLSLIPDPFQPIVVYGDEIADQVNLPDTLTRDYHFDRKEAALKRSMQGMDTVGDIPLPSDFSWPFIVPRGAVADFYGQPVAFLIFKSRTAFVAAKKIVQFNPTFQQYGPQGTAPTPPDLVPFTNYVRVAGPSSTDVFSYAQNHNDANYTTERDQYAQEIDQTIAAKTSSGEWVSVSNTFSMQAMDPMFMEPETGLAWHDVATKTLNLVTGTQSTDGDVATMLKMFADPSLNVETINLFSCYPGGGFGGRDSSVFPLNLAIAALFSGGQPVRLANDRFEQFQSGLKRHACVGEAELSCTSDGAIQALQSKMAFDSGGRRNLSPYVAQLAGVCAGGSYEIPMTSIQARAIYSNHISGGSQRGFGGPQAYFIIESLLDDIRLKLGLDPFAIRRTNLLQTGSKTVVGGPIDQSLQLSKILDDAEQHPIWTEQDAARTFWQEQGLSYGVGFAMSNQAYGTSGDGVIGAVTIQPDGTFSVETNAVDMGNGSATTLAISIANALGNNASTIQMGNATLWPMLQMDTSYSGGWDTPNWSAKGVGSSSACLTAFHQVHAVAAAAAALLAVAILPAARSLWGDSANGLTVSDLVWDDGSLTAPSIGAPALTPAQLAQQIYDSGGISGVLGHAYFQGAWAEGSFTVDGVAYSWPLDCIGIQRGGPIFSPVYRTSVTPPPPAADSYVRTTFAPCGNLIGVTVDKTTGKVQVRSSASFLNAGQIICEPLVSGQSQGGVAMAIGWTLLEYMPSGPDGPALGTWNLNRYHVAKAADVPLDQELYTLAPDDGETTGRGIAEAVMCSVAPAIANAVYDACGARMVSLPITPAKILGALDG